METRHGRYNEPGTDGKDIYGIKEKATEHINRIKANQATDDWTKNCNSKNVDIQAFIGKMQDIKEGKEVDWECPFCGGKVQLIEKENGHTVIGCDSCDMRIKLENN